MTETAWLADVVLPASAWPEKTGKVTNTDRLLKMGRRALNPPGDVRQDLWIVKQMVRGMGLGWSYDGADGGVASVCEDMRQALSGVITGVSWCWPTSSRPMNGATQTARLCRSPAASRSTGRPAA